MLPVFQPLPVIRKTRPFNASDWLFELKYDGFRARLGDLPPDTNYATVATEQLSSCFEHVIDRWNAEHRTCHMLYPRVLFDGDNCSCFESESEKPRIADARKPPSQQPHPRPRWNSGDSSRRWSGRMATWKRITRCKWRQRSRITL